MRKVASVSDKYGRLIPCRAGTFLSSRRKSCTHKCQMRVYLGSPEANARIYVCSLTIRANQDFRFVQSCTTREDFASKMWSQFVQDVWLWADVNKGVMHTKCACPSCDCKQHDNDRPRVHFVLWCDENSNCYVWCIIVWIRGNKSLTFQTGMTLHFGYFQQGFVWVVTLRLLCSRWREVSGFGRLIMRQH